MNTYTITLQNSGRLHILSLVLPLLLKVSTVLKKMKEYKEMAMYVVEINENTAETITKAVLKQIKKDTADGGIMEA